MKILDEISTLIDYLLVSRDRDKQSELELCLFVFAKEIKDKKEKFFKKKFPLEREKNKKFLEKREKHNSDLATTKAINKEFEKQSIDLEALEVEIELLEDQYKSIVRIANHINDRFIQDNVDNKRNIT